MITNYDPNISWARHTFELTFMQWDYSLTVQVEVLGNCKGASLFESAINVAFDDEYDTEDGTSVLVLKRPAEDGNGEDTLEVEFEDYEELLELCVSVKIVKFQKEDRNA
jgi:Family of unknown function (DUF5406)